MHPALWLLLAIVAEVVGTTALKVSDGFRHLIPVLVVVAGYGVSFWAMSMSLRAIPLGVVYAVWSGLGTVAIVLIGVVAFRESLDAIKIGGIALIMVGVVLLNVVTGSRA